jgi:hypothetical protein
LIGTPFFSFVTIAALGAGVSTSESSDEDEAEDEDENFAFFASDLVFLVVEAKLELDAIQHAY